MSTAPDTLLAGKGHEARWIWLSYVLGPDTPGYAGASGLEVERKSSIAEGCASNSVRLGLSNHLGTHVDAPLHFIAEGRSVDTYAAGDWIFTRPWVAELAVAPATLVDVAAVDTALIAVPTDVDLLLFRTGHGRCRGTDAYWRDGPGLAAELGMHLLARFPRLRAIGLDTISLTSYQHRDEGRRAHREFLGAGLRVFEDLALGEIAQGSQPLQVIALPMRFEAADGAPCSIVARI